MLLAAHSLPIQADLLPQRRAQNNSPGVQRFRSLSEATDVLLVEQPFSRKTRGRNHNGHRVVLSRFPDLQHLRISA
jgi:hypothetical protein